VSRRAGSPHPGTPLTESPVRLVAGRVGLLLVLQPQTVMLEVLSLVVACAGAGLVASPPVGPAVGVCSGVCGVGATGPESSDFVAG
ncbi:MAG: hypothetical protein LC749_06430, partial [Actinobacteria bacterium]|nr:hypothetical protein [Actinomycetota bacterium]